MRALGASTQQDNGWFTSTLIRLGGLAAAQPLTLLTYAMSSAAWTQRLLNVGLHAANAVLVVELLRRLLPKQQPVLTLLAALVFAVHPAQTEAICTISGRGQLLLTLVTLVALVAALRLPKAHLHRFVVGASICGALCYGEPLGGVIVAALVSVLRGQLLGAPDADSISSVATAWGLPAALVMLALPTSASAHDSPLNVTDGVVQYVLTWLYLVARHLALLVWPHPLAPDWSHFAVEPVASVKDSRVALIVAVGLALLVLSRLLPAGQPVGERTATSPVQPHAAQPPRPATSGGIGGALAVELFAEPAAPVSTTDLDRLEEAASASSAPRAGGARRRQLSKTRSTRTTATTELDGEPTSHAGLGSQLAVATLAPAPVAASGAPQAVGRVSSTAVPEIASEAVKAMDTSADASATKLRGAMRHYTFVPGALVLIAAVTPLLSARSLIEATVYPASLAMPLLLAAAFAATLHSVSPSSSPATSPARHQARPQRASWKVVITAAAASIAFLVSVYYCESVAVPQWQSRESYWRAALAVHPSNAGALQGMALLRFEAAAASGKTPEAVEALVDAQSYAQAAVDAVYALPARYPSLPLGDQILPEAVSVLATAAVGLGNGSAAHDALNAAVSRMQIEAVAFPAGDDRLRGISGDATHPWACEHGAAPYRFHPQRFQLTDDVYGIHNHGHKARHDAYFFLAFELAFAQQSSGSPAAADSLLRAAAIAQTLPDSALIIEPLQRLAAALEVAGQFAAAAHWYEQALQTLQRQLARMEGGAIATYGLQGPRKVAAQALAKQAEASGDALTTILLSARKTASAALQMTSFTYRAPLTLVDTDTAASSSAAESSSSTSTVPTLAVTTVPSPVCINIDVDALALGMRRFRRVAYNESLCSTHKDRSTACGLAVSAPQYAAKAAVLGLRESITALRAAAAAAGVDPDAASAGCACEAPLRHAPFRIPTRLCAHNGLLDPVLLREALDTVTEPVVQAGCPARREGGAVVGGTTGDSATVTLASAVARLLEATVIFDSVDQRQAYAHRLDEARLTATWAQLRGLCGCA